MTKKKTNKPQIMDTKKEESIINEKQTISENISSSKVDDLTLLKLANDLIDKQYRRYSIGDAKTYTLVTANSILLTTIGVLFKEALNDKFTLIFITLSIISVAISLYFALKQVIPIGSSGKTNASEPNIRSQNGILRYKNWNEYNDAFSNLDIIKLKEMNVRQIYGMSYNLKGSFEQIKKCVVFTIISVCLVLITFGGIILSTYNIHIFGEKFAKSSISTKVTNKFDSIKINIETPVKKADTLKNGRYK